MMAAGSGNGARSSRVRWSAHAGEREWTSAVVIAIERHLREALAASPRIWLLLSGGSTPVPVYRALADRPLDWERITLSLVDERDAPADSAGSNARLVRENLLRGQAAAAPFLPLREMAPAASTAVAACNARWPAFSAGEGPLCALAVLGMGADGHVASLFPRAANLDDVLASSEPYALVDAHGCPAAGEWPWRISLTPAGLAAPLTRLLLLRGEDKRALFERALGDGPATELPVRVAIDAGATPLEVHWSP